MLSVSVAGLAMKLTGLGMDRVERKLQLRSIQAGRGIAAVLVVFHHAGSIASEDRFYGAEVLGGVFRGFNVGVDYFFVLSGFIIAWIHWGDLGRPERLGRYVERRFLRVYPPYWGILLPLMALYALFPSAGRSYQHDPLNYLFSPLLLPYPLQPILGVAWTLVYEVMFYTLFAALIVVGSRLLWAVAAWAMAIMVVQITSSPVFPASTLFSAFILEFLLGLGAAVYLRSHALPYPRLWAILGAASFFVALPYSTIIQENSFIGRLFFGSASVAALAGFVEWERRDGVSAPTWLGLLGDASYAIYLVHAVTISFAIQIAMKAGLRIIPLPAMILILVAFGVTAGLVYHRFAEQRLIDATRRVVHWFRSAPSASS